MPGADPSALSGLNQHAGVQRAPQFINGTPVPAGVVPPTAPVSNLSTGAGNAANFSGQAIQGAPTVNASTQGVNAGVNAGGTAGGTAATATGAQTAKEVPGLSAATPAAKGIDGFGAAAAGLGVGLSAYDIASNGATFGNVTGLAGSAALGYAALTTGASMATPIGWALLGASALDSVFEIF